MRVQSMHSARIVSITRSAWAFALGAWIGVRMTRIPSDREDLEVFGAIVPVRSTTADEQTDEGADDEVDEGPHQPIVPG